MKFLIKNKFLIFFFIISTICFGANYTSKILGKLDGNVLINENVNEVHPSASLTKIMTSVLVVEAVEKGEISYDDMVTVPKEVVNNKESSIYLVEGQKVKLLDLLYATLVHSANDAAYTLADYLSNGNVDEFVDKMNEKAKEIGMSKTTFYTPNGLPSRITGKGMDSGSALDMYKLSVYAIKKSKIKEISSTKKITILNGKRTIENRNKLLGTVDGVYGLKTGFHDDAKYNISIAFKKNNEDYIVVIFGGKTEALRDAEVKSVINSIDSPKENIIYVSEDINLYKKQTATKEESTIQLTNTKKTIFNITDEVSVIMGLIINREESNNVAFDKAIIIH